MNKAILVILALFAIVSAEQFQTFDFNQGRLRFRSLDTTSGLSSYAFQNHSNNTGVTVNLGSDYLTKAGLEANTQTDMLLYLYSSTTGFCDTGTRWVRFKCGGDCGLETTKVQTNGPFQWIQQGNPFPMPLTIGSDSSSWKLASKAVLYNSGWEGTESITYITSSSSIKYENYIKEGTFYGFIGLGADGDAFKNFQGGHPLFSIKVSGTGSGQLIFGKDSTQYEASRASQVMKTDTNWTMAAVNVSIGPDTTAFTQSVSLLLDVQYPCLGLPAVQFDDIFFKKMVAQYKLVVDTSYGNANYSYVYKGDLANLPNIVIGLKNEQNLIIAPQAYTQKLADGVYGILISRVETVSNAYWNGDGTTTKYYYAVLGASVLSQYYTVFEQTAVDATPTVTFYPTYASSSTTPTPNTTASSSNWKTIAIIAVVVLVALVVISLAFKKKNNLTKSDLGVELRAARV